MKIFLSILYTAVGWFVLMWLSTNIIGMVVRGFFEQTPKAPDDDHPFIKNEYKKLGRSRVFVELISWALLLGFLLLVYWYLHIFVFLAAIMLMFSRIPDLIWEIKHGKKITRTDAPKGGIYTVGTLLDFASVPALWWGIFQLVG